MKKFFPLCLLLIVALVWTVSIADNFDRMPTANSDEKVTIEKPRSVIERPAVVQKQAKERIPWEIPASTEPVDLDRTPTATSSEAEKAPRIAAERAGEIVVTPITTGQRSASPRRMKEIKADGVISPDERAEYEELLSMAAPGVELPMPLNIVYESEYNDVCDSADAIACGDTVWCADLTYGTDDQDWYTFTLTETKQVTIETHPTGTDCQDPSMTDTKLELWEAPCDSMIAENDDIGGDPWNLFSRIVMTLTAGTYAILSDNYWDETGSYHLSLLCEDPPVGCPEDSLTIEITLDSYPEELSWDVVDRSDSSIVCSGGPYTGQTGVVTEVCCLDSTGCYDFNIYDAYGDGGGPYDLYFNDSLFYSGDGNYGYGETVSYIGNGCPDPTGACCVDTSCVATVTEDSCDVLSGDWFIDEDCSTFVCPYGACCIGLTCVGTMDEDACDVLGGDWYIWEDCSTFVCPYGACCLGDGLCTATTSENDCDALGGFWYENETCPDFQCLQVTSCDTAIYHNGDPLGGAIGSQCARDYPFVGEAADDFILPGTGTVDISEVVSWFWFFNAPAGVSQSPAYFSGINVTVYANDTISMAYPAPGGKPISPPDSFCSHMQLIPGGIVYTTQLLPGEFTYVPEGGPMWRLMLPICVTLNAGETYWLAVEPIMDFFVGGQCGWTPTDSPITGNISEQIFEALGTPVWTPRDPAVDLAFCLIEAPAVWSCVEEACMYTAPDNKQPGGIGDIEPNDTCTVASEALCEYAYCGDLSDSTDHDWYRVIIPQDGTYGLHVRVFANDTPNQYAQGGGLDPRVYLYASDCVTMAAVNDDYNGTFPDAELYDSQIDPGGANCFFPGDTVYIEIMTPWSPLGGPYLLIINCVPCEVPTGACCVNEECVATNYETECDALGGQWNLGFDCATYVNCAPAIECDSTAVYQNGDWAPIVYNFNVVQCDVSYPLQFANADDFTLPGTDSVNIQKVVAWIFNWNGNRNGPDDYDGVNVTIYNNDAISYPGSNFPGGQPINGDTLCAHMMIIPGGIVYETTLDPGLFAWSEVVAPDSICRLELPVDVMLAAGVKYWLEVQPIVQFAQAGQAGWMNSDTQTGDLAVQIAEMFGDSVWTVQDTFDLAFCLYGPPIGRCCYDDSLCADNTELECTALQGTWDPDSNCTDHPCPVLGCDYVIGNVNGDAAYNGLDVTYGVNWFKAIGPAPVCPDCPPCNSWYYCGDVNGQCDYNGLDITYNVNWFKQVGPAPVPCDDCPQIGGPAGDNSRPETPSVIKTKTIFEQKPGTK